MIEFIVLGLVILIASCLQASIGFGIGMLGSPVLMIFRPDLVPATIILLAVTISCYAFLRERSTVDWSVVLWATIGRLPGLAAGVFAVATFSYTGLSLTLAAAVIIGVAISLIGWTPSASRPNVMIAGLFSGLFGTSAGIGGPPISLVMRSHSGATTRATISAYFVLGSAMSLTGLALAGHLTTTHLAYALGWAPFMVAGIAFSSLVIKRASTPAIHRLAAIVSIVGALIVIAQALLG